VTDRAHSVSPDRVEALIADPEEHFAAPRDVVGDAGLDPESKRRILESWRKDAELLSEAQAENMGGGESARLREVELALAELSSQET
jgi:hypothetical protein